MANGSTEIEHTEYVYTFRGIKIGDHWQRQDRKTRYYDLNNDQK